MEKSVLTVKELSERWGIHERTIRKYLANGMLNTTNIPGDGVFFNLSYIEALEQCEELDPMSPLERRKLLDKIKELQKENQKLRLVVSKAQILFTEAVFNISKEL